MEYKITKISEIRANELAYIILEANGVVEIVLCDMTLIDHMAKSLGYNGNENVTDWLIGKSTFINANEQYTAKPTPNEKGSLITFSVKKERIEK